MRLGTQISQSARFCSHDSCNYFELTLISSFLCELADLEIAEISFKLTMSLLFSFLLVLTMNTELLIYFLLQARGLSSCSNTQFKNDFKIFFLLRNVLVGAALAEGFFILSPCIIFDVFSVFWRLRSLVV